MSNEINQDDDVMGLFEYFDIEKFKTTVDAILKATMIGDKDDRTPEL